MHQVIKNPVRVPKWAVEQDKFNKRKGFPNCQGTFPECPKEIDTENPDRFCKLCPMYKKV